jgi:hypothetical protein
MGLKIFLSYAREDWAEVDRYFDLLQRERFEPWIDFRKILPGQNWESEIDIALNEANVIVAFLSKKSVSKRGFVQREVNFALDRLRYKLPTDVYFIPVMLDVCEVPSHVSSRVQYVDLRTPNAWEQVIASLKLAASQQSIAIDEGIPFGPYRVTTKSIVEERAGQPGHSIEIFYPHFTLPGAGSIENELNSFFAGRARTTCVESRQNPMAQTPEWFPDPSEPNAQNGYWENFQLAYANETLVSLVTHFSVYGAGAAHPNHGSQSFNFFTRGGLHRLSVAEFFLDHAKAEEFISDFCAREIAREFWRRTGDMPDQGVLADIAEGCKPFQENFDVFTISKEGLTFYFSPYQVAAYALGSWEITVPFFDLSEFLSRTGAYDLIV